MDERGLRVEIRRDQLLCRAAEFHLAPPINFHLHFTI